MAATTDLLEGFKEISDAYDGYETAHAYFEGEVPEMFASEQLRNFLMRESCRYHFRLARTPVTALANRIELSAISVPNNDPASEIVKRIWDANDIDVQSAELHLRMLEFGDAYLMVWPTDEDDENIEDPGLADAELLAVGVEMTYHSPLSVRVVYDEEHQRRKKYAIQRWREDKAWRADIWYPDRIERFITRGESKGTNESDWSEFIEDEGANAGQWPLPNPTGEIPFFHFRTAMPYGRPAHYDAYSPQDAITKLLITQLSGVEFQGFPFRVGLTEPGAALNENGDDAPWDDDADAGTQLDGLPRVNSSLKQGAGLFSVLNGIKDVKQFDAADPVVFTEPVNLYMRLMAQLTNTPMHYFDPMGDVPSGESLRVADAPLVANVHRLERLMRGPWAEAWRFALRLLGLTIDSVDVRWKPAVTIDDPEGWQVIEAKQRNGVPMRQSLMEAGYTADQVEEWLSDNQEEMDLSRRVEILDAIATAVQKLGAAAALGVVDQAQVSTLIARVIGQVTPEPAEIEL